MTEFGGAYARLWCSDLLARGAPGVHFCTLNMSPPGGRLASLCAAHRWDGVPERVWGWRVVTRAVRVGG